MSMTAQRKDINDDTVIQKFAKRMQSIEFLDYLYLLTVADIRATSPKLWNSWKDSLLKELYSNTQRVLRRGLNAPSDEAETISSKQEAARATLLAKGLNNEIINKVWRTISKDYFLRFSVDDSVWHTIAIASCSNDELPLVLLRSHTSHGGAEIFCYVNDRAGTFAVCTATLDQLSLNILDARIITTEDKVALISFHVLESNNEAIFDLSREQYVVNTLKKNLETPENTQLNVERHAMRQTQYFETKTTVKMQQDTKKRYNIIEISTQDRPGVLSTIGQCFSKHKINVRNAKIASIGSIVEDIFFVTDAQDKLITDSEKLVALKASLIESLSSD
jgi:[protein-PII] uridylyltransferase